MELGARSTRKHVRRVLASTDRRASRSRRHVTLVWLRASVTLGIFVVYPACASVQHEAGTSVLGYGSGGATGDSSFDCDGNRTGTVEHTQVGAGGEVVRQSEGALSVGGHVDGAWGTFEQGSSEPDVARVRTNYALGNVGVFVRGDYLWVGHELGVGLTFRLDQATSPIPSPWYRLRLGRADTLFLELTAGSPNGFVLNQNLAGAGIGLPFARGVIRLGVSWGGRAVVEQGEDGGGILLARNTFDGGDVSAYLEARIHLAESVQLFAALEAGSQLPAARLGFVVDLDHASPTCTGACASETEPTPDEWGDDGYWDHPPPTGASGLAAPR